MNRPYLLSVSLLALSLVAATSLATATGAQAAPRGEVICKFVKVNGKKRVSCPKNGLRGKRGKRGKRGLPGAAGAPGPAGPTGASGAGSGLTLNFNAKLGASANKPISIGNFTIRAASDQDGACAAIRLFTGSLPSHLSIGSGVTFTGLSAFGEAIIQSGNKSSMFTAISNNGASTISGIVGAFGASGHCLVSGYVTGV